MMTTEEEKDKLYNSLRNQIERMTGVMMKTRRHYDMMAEMVFKHTGNMLSPTTLRRFWGYQEADVTVSKHTLDVLSMFVGHRNWDDFTQAYLSQTTDKSTSNSNFIINTKAVKSADLAYGQQVVITWLPDRRIVVEHVSDDVFQVVSNENSKLQPGDIFHCSQLVNGMPLLCTNLQREGVMPMSYIGGKEGGISFTLL